MHTHPDLFDNDVLIFQSMENVDSLLEEMQNMSYEDLRSQYSALGHNNSNIENCILIDSLYYVISQYLGYTSDQELEDYQKALLDSLVYCEVMQINPLLLISYTITDTDPSSENVGSTYAIIEPRAELDLTALMNDKRLCIIEANVVKLLLDGTLITSPLLNYQYISGYESLEQLELLDTNNASSFADTTAIIWQPLYENNMQRNNNSIDISQVKYVNGNYYMMTLTYNIARLYNLFGLVGNGDYNFCAHLTIKNYKKGCFNYFWLSRLNTIGSIESYTTYENNTMYGSDECWHNFIINKKFSTYIKYQSKSKYVGFFRPYYYISYYNIDISNGRNSIELSY